MRKYDSAPTYWEPSVKVRLENGPALSKGVAKRLLLIASVRYPSEVLILILKLREGGLVVDGLFTLLILKES